MSLFNLSIRNKKLSPDKNGFFRRRLANGSFLIGEIRPNDSGAALDIAFPFGGMHTQGRFLGAAHVLEHMAFKEREKNLNNDHYEALKSVGGKVNGGTGFYVTDFNICVPLRHLDLALNYMHVLLQKPKPLTKQLNEEIEIIGLELDRSYDHPEEHIHEIGWHTIWEGTSPSSILGTRDTLKGITPDVIDYFWRMAFHPSKAVIAYVGGPTNICSLVNSLNRLIKITSKQFENPSSVLTNPNLIGRPLSYRERRKGLEESYVTVSTPSPMEGSGSFHLFDLLTYSLTEVESSRVYELVRVNALSTYRVNGVTDSGMFYVHLGVPNCREREVIKLIKRGFRESLKINSKEFLNLKQRVLGTMETEEDDRLSKASVLLNFEILGNGAEYVYQRTDSIKNANLSQFRKLADVPFFGESILYSN